MLLFLSLVWDSVEGQLVQDDDIGLVIVQTNMLMPLTETFSSTFFNDVCNNV